MTSPAWLADILAAVVLVIAAFSAARLVAARGRRRRGEVDADGMHVLMGVAMAGMFVPRLATLPTAAWGAVFGLGAVWFAGRAWRDRGGRDPLAGRWCAYPVSHLLDCVAMAYVLWAVPAMAAGAGPAAGGGAGGMGGAAGGARLPALGLALAGGICVYVVWLLDRLPAARARPGAAPGPAYPGQLSAGSPASAAAVISAGPALLAPARRRVARSLWGSPWASC